MRLGVWVLAGLLLMGSGCTSAPPAVTVTTTATTTVAPPPPARIETDIGYVADLLDASTGFVGAINVYNGEMLDGFRDEDWEYMRWAADRAINVTHTFVSDQELPKWNGPTPSSAHFHDLVLVYGRVKLTRFTDARDCAVSNFQGNAFSQDATCRKWANEDRDASRKASADLEAEIALWRPAVMGPEAQGNVTF
jgi:hypothetical protein